MEQGNVFFIKAREFCQKRMQTAAPEDTAAMVARKMLEQNVSSIVVVSGEKPVGIITDKDLRNKVILVGADAREITASNVMSSPLVFVEEDDDLFEAVYKMSKHKIHRIAVVDPKGELCGIITDSDILRLQANTPQFLIRDIEHAQSIEDLKKILKEITMLVISLHKTGVKTPDIVRLIAHMNDSLLLRIIKILKRERFGKLPGGFAFVALGSEGRMEQTLKTDQDNAIIYSDDLTPAEIEELTAFSSQLVDSLIEVGVPPCPGGTMAKNAPWRKSLGEWKSVVDKWIAVPSHDSILHYSMFSDVRTVYGDPNLEFRIKEHIIRRGSENAIFLAHMAKNVVNFEPPLGLFGKLKLKKEGEHKGLLDVKSGGIFPISDGIKVLALEGGFLTGGTREKIELLCQSGSLSLSDGADLLTSFNFFSTVRLRSQIREIEAGKPPSNFINLDELNNIEKMSLKIGFEAVKSFQNLLKLRFRLDFISD
jgi:CBS domain-containing protein